MPKKDKIRSINVTNKWTHQTQEDGTLRQKHPDEVAEAGCGDCGQVLIKK